VATDPMNGITIFDLQGDEVRFDSLWNDSPVLITWLRHYG